MKWLLAFVTFAALLGAPHQSSATDLSASWEDFKNTFISVDGRVIDWQNEQQSHSEGQGYALLLAVHMDDKETFTKVFTWSNNNLGSGLRAWKWGKNNSQWGILDANNATDGDLLHAWALLLAGEKWHYPAYTQAGRDIARLISRNLVINDGILLPGMSGFKQTIGNSSHLQINLSYYIYPAFQDLIKYDSSNAHIWSALYTRGLSLLRQSANTQNGLVPDWIGCDQHGNLLTTSTPAHFGYEAIRIPLYLSLAKEYQDLALFRQVIIKSATDKYLPAEVLLTNAQAATKEEALAGYYAILAKSAFLLGLETQAATLWGLAKQKADEQKGNYYGTVLYLLALLH